MSKNIFDEVQKSEKDAEEYGFAWQESSQILEQIRSECNEINQLLILDSEQINQAELQAELGDLLHAACSLIIFLGFDPEQILASAVNKFENRLNQVKKIATAQGKNNLKNSTFKELMDLWNQAKSTER